MPTSPKHAEAVAVEDAAESRALPAGWTLATISELIGRGGKFTDGDWVESKDQDPSGDIRLIQLADVGDGVYLDKSSRFLTAKKSRDLKCTYLVPGDVLIARMPDPLGRACIYTGDPKTSVTAVDVCIVRTGVNGPDHHWLAWFVNSPEFRYNVALLQSGSTRKRISRKNLATIALPVPPLAEQRRIVAEIEKHFTRLDASVTALKRVQANQKRYRASVLKAACEGKLVPTEAAVARSEGCDYESADCLLARILAERRARWEAQEKRRGKYVEPSPPDPSDLPELPEGWAWATLDQLATIRTGSTPLTSKTEYYQDGSVPWVTSSALNDPVVSSPGNYITQQAVEEYRLSLYPIHTLLIAMYGEGKTRGKCSELMFPSTINQAIATVTMEDSADDCRAYSKVFLHGNYEATRRLSSGGVQPNLNLGLIKGLAIPLPPLAEQCRIVAEVERRLSVAQKAEASVEANLRRVERLRQSILKQAFSGKLVPQDRNDEPASALLVRIRVEREASHPAAKIGRPTRPRRSKSLSAKQLVLREGNP